MPLEVVIFGADGSPERTVEMDVEQHHRLFRAVGLELSLLRRMSEYYEDASYAPEELALLQDEVRVLATNVAGDAELRQLLSALLELLEIARQRSCVVAALAD
jgi:hypothetical protein